jgi:hypothetical protein
MENTVKMFVYSENELVSNPVLVSAYIYKGINKTGNAELVFEMKNPSENENNMLVSGKKIRIEAGYGEDKNPLFEGSVVSNKLIMGKEGKFYLQIACDEIIKSEIRSSTVLKVIFGKNLIQFQGEISQSEQAVEMQSEKTVLSNSAFDVSAKPILFSPKNLMKETKSANPNIIGYCTIRGTFEVVSGGTIELSGLGSQFNGFVSVGYVEHEIKSGTWITTIGLGLSSEVIERIEHSKSNTSTSENAIPYDLTITDTNFAFISKSMMKIEFDETKNVITIETPHKNKFILSDEDKGIQLIDQNRNKIVMNNSGITIESAAELILKANTNITIDAGAKLDAKAKSDLQLKGMNVNASADMELLLKGNAKAELSASGQTIVKGTMVMIN